MSILLAAAVTVGILLIIGGLYLPRTAPDPVRTRLSYFVERPKTLEEIELEQPFTDRIVRPILTQISRVMTKFIPKKRTGKEAEPSLSGIQKRLLLAGNPGNLSPNDMVGIMGISMLGLSGLIFLLLGLAGADVATAAMVAMVGLALGYLLPTFWLSAKIQTRQREIQRALPDALDLLVISVEAGLGFDAAVQRVTEKSDNGLAREFRRFLAEIQMGRTRREALREMVNRCEVPDLNTFVSAIIQGDQLGVSVSRILSVQADQMRLLRRQRAEELAAKAPLKMLFPMVFLIFPSMFIVILGPVVPTLFGGGLGL